MLTLSIIGIVAAMTIPSIIANVESAEAYARLAKAQTTFQHVIKMYMAENAITDLAISGLFSGNTNPQPAWTAFKPYFNLVKDCDTTAGQGCFAPGVTYKYLNGTNASILDNRTDIAKGKFADGVSINIFDANGNCDQDASRNNAGPLYNSYCGTFNVDINGDKGPNKVGIDYFTFRIVRNGTIYAMGALDDITWGCNRTGGTTSTDGYAGWGQGCAAVVLKKVKLIIK